MFSNSMVSWFVGSLQSPGCKRVGIGCIFYLSSGAFEGWVPWSTSSGLERNWRIFARIHLSLSTTFSHFSESAFFSLRPDTFFILVNMGWICSQPNFFNIQSGEILHRLFKSVRILHIGQNCKVEAEFNSPNMKSDWINVQKWMILWVTIPFSDQFFFNPSPWKHFRTPS